MKLDENGKKFIFNQEGIRLKAYKDSGGVPTICVGCTYYSDGSKVKIGDSRTMQECYQLFDLVVADFEKAVTKAVKVPINQNQFNALVSFAFNVGTGGVEHSSLLTAINSKASETEIRLDFAKWNKVQGIANDVLTKRRKMEADLFFKAINNENPNH
ncbi:lysozyme [Mucilaginibacter gracilis]|uniref:Lysozyme n=1 Tax=Mucilaginibacter gracilis TaxID=423350 RepID=A0A495J103_9SPHI|nr:lysozyme [Mucilaginibacter gracilis]RKR82665.1 lysozyme [Mucilaginibacter gracilis]